MGTAIEHPVSDEVKPSFVMGHLGTDTHGWASECPDVKNCLTWSAL